MHCVFLTWDLILNSAYCVCLYEGKNECMHAALQQANEPVQVWGLQAVQAVVNFKWNTWACYYLYCELACYLVWLLGFQVFTIIFQVILITPVKALCSSLDIVYGVLRPRCACDTSVSYKSTYPQGLLI